MSGVTIEADAVREQSRPKTEDCDVVQGHCHRLTYQCVTNSRSQHQLQHQFSMYIPSGRTDMTRIKASKAGLLANMAPSINPYDKTERML
jgi:hypothetical protein